MSGTHVFYAGVLLRDCEISNWRQEIVKDDSGTDVLYSKVTLTIESTLISLVNQPYIGSYPHGLDAHPSTIAVPQLNQETIVDRWEEVQWRLQQHREDFWMALHGVTYNPVTPQNAPPAPSGKNNDSYRVVLAATGLSPADLEKMRGVAWSSLKDVDLGKLDGFHNFGAGTPAVDILRNKVIDLNNGPKPLDVSVTKILGGQSLRVVLKIEICRCFCKPLRYDDEGQQIPNDDPSPAIGSDQVHGVISNKWSLTETTDPNWNSEHLIRGKMVVSDARYKPHAMRLMAIPSMAPYFKMESREFATDPTGLVLSYMFRMKETGPAPLEGIVDWKGVYREKSAPGGHHAADISVQVTGQANPVNAAPGAADKMQSNKAYLIRAAYRIAQSRIRWSTQFAPLPGQNPKSITLSDMTVVERMDKSEIELRVSVLYTDSDQVNVPVMDNFGLRLKNMGASLKNVAPQYDDRWWPIPGDFPWDATTVDTDLRFNGQGSYFDNYFQVPCSLWHASLEAPEAPASQLRNQDLFAPIAIDDDLNSTDPLDQPPGVPVSPSLIGWSNEQSVFSYLQVEIDTKHSMHSGNIQLPLSKPRVFSQGQTIGDSCIVVNLFPGLAQRVITMVATRIGDWPKVPSPKDSIVHGSIRETFLNGETVADVPKLSKDGKTLFYSMQVKWVYALSRLPTVAAGDSLLAASDPRVKTTPSGNAIKMSSYFTDGIIEMA